MTFSCLIAKMSYNSLIYALFQRFVALFRLIPLKQTIQRAAYRHQRPLAHMCVQQGSLDIRVPQKLLNQAYICIRLQQVRSVRVPQGMKRGFLIDTRFLLSPPEHRLQTTRGTRLPNPAAPQTANPWACTFEYTPQTNLP